MKETQEPWGEDPLEKEMATHSSIPAWKIPWTEETGRLPFMESQSVGHDWATKPLPPRLDSPWLWMLSTTAWLLLWWKVHMTPDSLDSVTPPLWILCKRLSAGGIAEKKSKGCHDSALETWIHFLVSREPVRHLMREAGEGSHSDATPLPAAPPVCSRSSQRLLDFVYLSYLHSSMWQLLSPSPH